MQDVLARGRMVSKVLALGRDDELDLERQGVRTRGRGAEPKVEGLSISTPRWDTEQGLHSGNGMLSEYRRRRQGPVEGRNAEPVPGSGAEC